MTPKESFYALKDFMNSRIIGQPILIERLLIALLADGHLLVEGAPGLAKTKAVKTLAECVEANSHRIQFTPDLLPADITGSDVYRPETNTFFFQKGPIFQNLLLADEINRAPAKVQSALLEAMGERQVTIGNQTYQLPELFMVMATQNPIENEGTYNLPEAQLDRFMMYIKIDYPDIEAERKILTLIQAEEKKENLPPFPKIRQSVIFDAKREVLDTYMSPDLQEYLIQFVIATRNPTPYDKDLSRLIAFGASPRGTIALDIASRAMAWLNNRDYVMPSDIQAVMKDVLRNRIILSFEAKSEGYTTDRVLDMLMQKVPLP
jgi:MoxR-like ATPase